MANEIVDGDRCRSFGSVHDDAQIGGDAHLVGSLHTIARGSLSGGLPDDQQSVIGEGQVPWPSLMAAAEKDGFEEYYLEDETPDPLRNVPASISYLEGLRYPR